MRRNEMSERCLERDQDLLLLVHGELSWPRHLLTRAHLCGCTLCRQRRAQFQWVSQALARAIGGRGVSSERASRLRPSVRTSIHVGAWLRLAALLLAMILLGLLIVQIAERLSSPRHEA